MQHDNLPWLSANNGARRELGNSGVETFKRLCVVKAELTRRLGPDALRWIDGFRPRVDAAGNWNPGAILRATKRPLTVREALAKQNRRAW